MRILSVLISCTCAMFLGRQVSQSRDLILTGNIGCVKSKTSHIRTPKVLLYVTTAASALHRKFLRELWPELLCQSDLLRNVDVVMFSTGNRTYNSEMSRAFSSVAHFVVLNEPNPGYQRGANLAMTVGMERQVFVGYDWLIRVNPDVIIRNSTWIFNTMLDPDVDAIFVDCYDGCLTGYCKHGVSVLIHTDFFAVRPQMLTRESFSMDTFAKFSNAEHTATHAFQHILQSGRYQWLPNTGPMRGNCRVRGEHSPVLHTHNIHLNVTQAV